MKKIELKRELILLALDVVQQYGYRVNAKRPYYHDGGFSTQENCFDLLFRSGVIKNRNKVYASEANKYYKTIYPDEGKDN